MRISSIALLITLTLPFLRATAQETTDTVAALDKVRGVLVTRTGDTTRIFADVIGPDGEKIPFEYEVSVVEKDSVGEIGFPDVWGINLPFYTSDKERRPKKVERDIVGLEHGFWGWRFNYHDKGHVKNSYEIGFKQLIGIAWSRGKLHSSTFRSNPSTFSIGLGFTRQRYLAQDGFAYSKVGDKIVLNPISNGQRVKSSHMDVWSFNVPVLYKQRFARNLHFCIGGIMNLNSYASAQTEINEGKAKQKIKLKGLQQNLFTADAYFSLGFDVISVYVTWSPMNVFKSIYGPELRSWSIGVDLFSF